MANFRAYNDVVAGCLSNCLSKETSGKIGGSRSLYKKWNLSAENCCMPSVGRNDAVFSRQSLKVFHSVLNWLEDREQ